MALNPTGVVLRGRAASEALMVDACTVQRQASETSNPDTGAVTRNYTAVYSGKCRFSGTSSAGPALAGPQELGGASVLVSTPVLQLPIAVTGVQADDLVTCTAAAMDPGLAGRTWRARPGPRKTHATKTVIGLVEVTG